MGFFSTPKINVPSLAPESTEEPPVKVEDVKAETIKDYSAKAKQRKTLLSTVLNKRYAAQETSQSTGMNGTDGNLRSTLG